MYVPPKFSLEQDAAWAVVRDAGSGFLVVAGAQGLRTVFVPVVVSEDRSTLRTHVAKANPWWRDLADETPVVGVFLSASAYVSPSYYPSRVEDPGVVPTWNYVASEVRGTLRVVTDEAWLLEQVGDVTATFEAGRSPEWLVRDAPEEYVRQQLRAIVGVEITVTGIEGKAKLSQNRPAIDHDSVRAHLGEGTLTEQHVARQMWP